MYCEENIIESLYSALYISLSLVARILIFVIFPCYENCSR